MKRLILFLIIIAGTLSINSQVAYNWTDTVTISTVVSFDTIIQPAWEARKPIDVSGMGASVTVVASADLDSTCRINFGGSNYNIGTPGNKVYSFEGFPHDSLPYTVDLSKMLVITNGDTSYQKTFDFDYYKRRIPMIEFLKDSTTTGTIITNWIFYKK